MTNKLATKTIQRTDTELKLIVITNCKNAGPDFGPEILIRQSGTIDIKSPCEAVPDILKQIVGCTCSDLLKSARKDFNWLLQSLIWHPQVFANYRRRRTCPIRIDMREPIWQTVFTYQLQRAEIFDSVPFPERHHFFEDTDLLPIIGLLRFSKTLVRREYLQLNTMLLKRWREVFPDVIGYRLSELTDERELFDELISIARTGDGQVAEDAFKALHRIGLKSEFSILQLKEILALKNGTISRAVEGRFEIAVQLLEALPTPDERDSMNLISMLSDALLAAPSQEQGIEAQKRLLGLVPYREDIRRFILENLTRLRT
ncbi:hypothetical protein SH501x_003222 [Pirellulaceae bacterium SH501]